MIHFESWHLRLAGVPFGAMFNLCLILAAVAFLLSLITRDHSWVDRLWSICPPIIAIWVAASNDFDSIRLSVMAMLISL